MGRKSLEYQPVTPFDFLFLLLRLYLHACVRLKLRRDVLRSSVTVSHLARLNKATHISAVWRYKRKKKASHDTPLSYQVAAPVRSVMWVPDRR